MARQSHSGGAVSRRRHRAPWAAALNRPLTAQAAAPAVPAIPTSMQNELVAAQEICSRAKTAVVEMFGHARMGRALELEHISALVDDISSSSPATLMPLSAWHA